MCGARRPRTSARAPGRARCAVGEAGLSPSGFVPSIRSRGVWRAVPKNAESWDSGMKMTPVNSRYDFHYDANSEFTRIMIVMPLIMNSGADHICDGAHRATLWLVGRSGPRAPSVCAMLDVPIYGHVPCGM